MASTERKQDACARLPACRVAARRRPLRDPRRGRRDRGAAPVGPRSRSRAVGHLGALPGARDRARRAPRSPRCRLQRPLDRDVVDPVGARGRAGRTAVGRRARPLDRRRAPRHPARPQGDGRDGARERLRRRVRDLRGGQLSPPARDHRAARAHVRGRPAGHAAARDPDADPRPGDVRDGRAAARDGAAGLALVPPLPPRRVRRLRTALGPARGRPVRPRGAPLRGDGRRGADDQLPARRPRAGHRLVAARLHRAAARRLPEPRPSRRGRAGGSTTRSGPRRTPSSRAAGARRARRSSAAAAA